MEQVEENKIINFINNSPQRSIYCYPWWLEAVSGNRYRYVVVENDSDIELIIPVVIYRRFGFSLCTMPPFTQSLGILLPPTSGKYVTRLSNEHKVFDSAINYLPRCNYYNIRFHPNITNWLPFYWRGFQQTTRYTYILRDITNPDCIWESMRTNIRREIRKANKQVKICNGSNIELLIKLRDMTYIRKNKKPGHNSNIIRRIYKVCSEKNQCKLFFAKDASNRTHSGLLLIWDDRTAYYLIGGSDPELRSSGGASLLMWRAIQFTSNKVKQFNFEGSMDKNIERYFRSFGAEQIPYYSIFRFSPRILAIFGSMIPGMKS